MTAPTQQKPLPEQGSSLATAPVLSKQNLLLLDLRFLVNHMFPDHWVVLFDFDLVRGGSLVLSCGVEMPCSSRGHESDLVAH